MGLGAGGRRLAPGRGGVSRGRGDAPLWLAGASEGDTSALRARKLPSGRAIPREWTVTGFTRAAPRPEPERPAAASGRAGADGPGVSTWRRRLAPHHRAVVRRFFDQRPASGK